MAEGGTIFLDEIGDMPLHLQTKLLSVLEDKTLRRIGSTAITPVNVRIIAATNADLENALGKTFRKDLYYRLSVVRIHIPPLREHREDIPALCGYLLSQIAKGRGVEIPDTELAKLKEYELAWKRPGAAQYPGARLVPAEGLPPRAVPADREAVGRGQNGAAGVFIAGRGQIPRAGGTGIHSMRPFRAFRQSDADRKGPWHLHIYSQEKAQGIRFKIGGPFKMSNPE